MKLDDKMPGIRLKDKIVVITGAAGLLGQEHAKAVLSEGGIAILLDIDYAQLEKSSFMLVEKYPERIFLFRCNITKDSEVESLALQIVQTIGTPTGLVNNAAINPSVERNTEKFSRIEDISYIEWSRQFDVGLYGSFLCTKVFGNYMIEKGIMGSIVNISSDHGLIAPNQSLYEVEGIPENEQPVKPVTYSVIKHGLIGLSKYFATYWAKSGIRSNTLCPGGVANGQPLEFLERFNSLVPLGRPAFPHEYQGAVIFLLSEDSNYMTGSTIVIDGGRSVW